MKLFKKIKWSTAMVAVAACTTITSCNFLDVVPPEQPELPDAVKDAESTLGFLYSCYAGLRCPISCNQVEGSTDEYAAPVLWQTAGQTVAFGQETPQSIADWRWGTWYRFIGQSWLFLQELPKAKGVTEEQRKLWAAEAKFMIAYYHAEALRYYGPCPITDRYTPMDTPNSEYPGRSHYDYVVDWIVNLLDTEVIPNLPPVHEDVTAWGRATSVIAKALKARVLMYAASPLWNGEFPFPDWKNKNYETPGYGKELVSHTYDRNKWVRAEKACEEALEAALAAGFKLYDDEGQYEKEDLSLPYIPGINYTTEEEKEFGRTVMKMRYAVAQRASEGNKELVWGVNKNDSWHTYSLPPRVLKLNSGSWYSGYAGVSPFLYTIEHFYTKNGKLPEKDKTYLPKSEWLKSAGIQGREDIINLAMDREPRFYAWMAFNGGDVLSKLCSGSPLKLELRNGELHGYNPANFNRDHCTTGFLNQKFLQPNLNLSANNSWNLENKPAPLIRMAELYLNLAECRAALAEQDKSMVSKSLDALNKVRERAGIPDVTEADLQDMPLMEWVRNERFVELWGEGQRFYDIRRWAKGPEYLAAGKREGLNAETIINPTFEEYNQRIKVNQPFKWENRMYLEPVFYNEVYKNPQMVQAPGY